MENTKLTERFPISENGWLIQDFNGIHRLVKLTVNKDFLAVFLLRQIIFVFCLLEVLKLLIYLINLMFYDN